MVRDRDINQQLLTMIDYSIIAYHLSNDVVTYDLG